MSASKFPYAKILISFLLVGILVYTIGWNTLLLAVALVPLHVFLILIIIALATLALNILAVWALYRTVSPISLGEFTPAFLSSWAAGFFLPGKVGGLSLTILLKHHVKPGVSAAIFVLDKIVTIILALLLGSFFLRKIVQPELLVWGGGAVIIGLLVASGLVLTNPGRALLRKLLGSRSGFFAGFSDSLPLFIAKPSGLFFNAMLTLARSAIQALSLFYLFSSFHFAVSWWDMVALSASENLASLVPVTISGIGLRELVVATFSTQLGYPFSFGVAAGLIMTAVTIIVVIPAILSFDEKKLFANIKK